MSNIMDISLLDFTTPYKPPPEGYKDTERSEIIDGLKNLAKNGDNIDHLLPSFTTSLPENYFGKRTFKFEYNFDPSCPWYAKDIINSFKIKFKELEEKGEFSSSKLNLSYSMDTDKNAMKPRSFDDADTKLYGDSFLTKYRKDGYDSTTPKNYYSETRFLGTLYTNANLNPIKDTSNMYSWYDIENTITKLDQYDDKNNIALEIGNRLSRLNIYVSEFVTSITRFNEGKGLKSTKVAKGTLDINQDIAKEIDVHLTSIMDLPNIRGSNLCGQSCLAYIIEGFNLKSKLPYITLNDKNKTKLSKWRESNKITAHMNALRLNKEMSSIWKLTKGSGLNFDHLDLFTKIYNNLSITVYKIDTGMFNKEKFVKIHVSSSSPLTPCNAFLLLHEDHYYIIRDIKLFLDNSSNSSRNFYCQKCKSEFKNQKEYSNHSCNVACKICNHEFLSPEDKLSHMIPTDSKCPECNFSYCYKGCISNHKHNSKSNWICPKCNGIYNLNRKEDHICDEKYCVTCSEYYTSGDHICYIKKLGLPKKLPEAGNLNNSCDIYVYDAESLLNSEVNSYNEVVYHKLSVIVLQKLYSEEQMVLNIDSFIEWILSVSKKTIVYAHNGGRYDNYLLKAELLKRGKKDLLPKNLIMNGRKIISMKVGKCIFRDSMMHISAGLPAMSSMFELTETKGFFPYRFYNSDNEHYVGKIPSIGNFDIQKFDRYRKNMFYKWYKFWLLKNKIGIMYNIKEECITYCRLDTKLLANSLEKYRDAGIIANTLDPLMYVTIAGYAINVYRANHMPSESIQLLDKTKYDFIQKSFFGGRTECRQLYRKWSLDDVKKGNYAELFDITSQYAAVMLYDILPYGKISWVDVSKISSCEEWIKKLDNKVAIIECTFICNKKLYHPVLVTKDKGKLIASLEITSGVYTSTELLEAINQGYKITSITRALICSGDRGQLFNSYIDKFAEMKIKYSPGKPLANPGLRSLAKLMLVSLWGKFGERDNYSECAYFHRDDPLAWNKLLERYENDSISDIIINESTENYICVTFVERYKRKNKHTNLMLASFITAGGRLRLYEHLSKLGDRVLYHDTDSIIYERKPGMYNIPVGTGKIGEWDDVNKLSPNISIINYSDYDNPIELCSDLQSSLDMHSISPTFKISHRSDPIICFAGLGPKLYSYITRNGSVCVKAKGFNSGFSHCEYVRHIKDYLHNGVDASKLIQDSNIWKRSDGNITTEPYKKQLMASMLKVNVISASRTEPFGYSNL